MRHPPPKEKARQALHRTGPETRKTNFPQRIQSQALGKVKVALARLRFMLWRLAGKGAI